MVIVAISMCLVVAYIVMLIVSKPHDRTGLDRGRIMDTVHAVRLIYLAGLCAVPLLVAVSIIRDNVYIYTMAESGVPVISGALFLVGLSALGQTSLAKHFNMHTAFSNREIYIMMGIPVVLYLTFLPWSNPVLIYMAPGIYSGCMIYLTIKKKVSG